MNKYVLLKHVYGNFQHLIQTISIVLGLSCDKALALPQDLPCSNFELNKTEVITNSKDEFEYKYIGKTPLYTIEINLMGNHQDLNLFANCGSAGCGGVFRDNKTGKSENLRFFCENNSDNYSKVKCSIVKGDEFIFNQINGIYKVNYCLDDKTKILIFDKNKCNNCHCTVYEKDNTQILLKMGCDFKNNIAHCFSYSGYEEWRNFENNENDFKNCVKLKFD